MIEVCLSVLLVVRLLLEGLGMRLGSGQTVVNAKQSPGSNLSPVQTAEMKEQYFER